MFAQFTANGFHLVLQKLFHLKAFIWQKFAGQRDVDAIAGWTGLTIDFEIEVDGAHDAVAELILDDFFHSRSKNTDHLSHENGQYHLQLGRSERTKITS